MRKLCGILIILFVVLAPSITFVIINGHIAIKAILYTIGVFIAALIAVCLLLYGLYLMDS